MYAGASADVAQQLDVLTQRVTMLESMLAVQQQALMGMMRSHQKSAALAAPPSVPVDLAAPGLVASPCAAAAAAGRLDRLEAVFEVGEAVAAVAAAEAAEAAGVVEQRRRLVV